MTHPPLLLDDEATLASLRDELDRFVGLVARTPVELRIPSCPDWSASDLFAHLGAIHRWVAAILRRRSTERVSRRSIDTDAPADGDFGPWLAEGAAELLAALCDTDPEEVVWTWGPDHRARWWARRMLHETAVHGADLTIDLGERWSVDPVVGADGICELLDNSAARLTWPDARPPARDGTVHLHATDTGLPGGQGQLGEQGEWLVEIAAGAVTHTHGHAKGDAALRAPVDELVLVMNRRAPVPEAGAPNGPALFGDRSAIEALIDAAGH